MYGRITNGKFIPSIFPLTDEQQVLAGFKLVEDEGEPNDGYEYTKQYVEEADKIKVTYVRGEKTLAQQLTDLQLALTELYEGGLING